MERPIVSRAEAIARGLTRYFTGRPCPQGHVVERHTQSKTCTACNRVYGLRRTSWRPVYGTWRHMRERCADPRHSEYHLYGGRGIKVCDRWRNSYEIFAADMGPRPSPTHSIDRIDVNGNYEPGNCRWATPKEQRHNQRRRAA